MNKRFVISVVVLFFVSMALGFIVHATLLNADYQKLVPGVFRSPQDAETYFPCMIAAHILIAIGFTWVYRAGRDNRPWLGQGVRFGLAIAVLCTIPGYLIYFAVEPLPSDLVAKQIVFDTICMVIMGIVVAALNRDPVTRSV
jgi:uncharacterized BrkB/YihY/UPF0761 family membrane protein